jgi:hypothetical protein
MALKEGEEITFMEGCFFVILYFVAQCN